jgi:predicted dehydrogenase
VLEDPEVDSIIVATPPDTHYPIIRKALQKGKHVFSEKPLTLGADEAEELAILAITGKLHLFTDYVYTFSPAIRKMIGLAQDGAVGEVHGFNFSIRQLGHFSGNVYHDLGCHILSIMDLMIPLDQLEFTRTDILVRDGIVETGQVSFKPAGKDIAGGRGTIFLSFNHPVKERNMTIYGNTGTLIYDFGKQYPLSMARYRVDREISRNPLEQVITNYEFEEKNTLCEVVQGFHDVLSGISPSNLDLSVRVTKTLEKIWPRK